MLLQGEGRFSSRAELRLLAKRSDIRSPRDFRAGVRRDVRLLVDEVRARVRVPLRFVAERRLVVLFLLAAEGFLGILIDCK